MINSSPEPTNAKPQIKMKTNKTRPERRQIRDNTALSYNLK